MADIHDWQEATRETDEAVRALDVVAGRAEDGDAGAAAVPLAICMAGRAIALAIREASVRSDYITRDVMRGRA